MIGGDCQDAQNVLTDNGYLEKRPGNVFLSSVTSTHDALLYNNEWVAPGGSRFLVTQASNTVRVAIPPGTTSYLNTVANGFQIMTTPAFSKLFFADGYRPLWYWDGNSTATVTDFSGNIAPICTYTGFKDSRMWCANIPNESTSRVRVSSSGGGGYFTVPYNAFQLDNAANYFDLNPDDGDYITCMAATPWGMFVGKRQSTWVIKGTGNLSYEVRQLHTRIGCADNGSVQLVYGSLVWLGLDGVYAWDGGLVPTLISPELDPMMTKTKAYLNPLGIWSTQLPADWNAGLSDSDTLHLTPSWDPNTVPGEIFPSSRTFSDNVEAEFRQGTVPGGMDTGGITTDGNNLRMSTAPYNILNGNFATGDLTHWTCVATAVSGPTGNCAVHDINQGSPTPGTTNYTKVFAFGNGVTQAFTLAILRASDDTVLWTRNDGQVPSIDTGLTLDLTGLGLSTQSLKIQFGAHGNGTETTLTSNAFVAVSSISYQVFGGRYNNGGNSDNGVIGITNVEVNTYFDQNLASQTRSLVSRTYDTRINSPVGLLTQIQESSAATTIPIAWTFQYSTQTSGPWTSVTGFVDGQTVSGAQRYWRYEEDFTSAYATMTAESSAFQITAVETGTYYSKVEPIDAAITSWRLFAVNTLSPTPYDFYVRTATYAFSITDALPAWVAQEPNDVVAASTATYAEFKIDSSFLGPPSYNTIPPISGIFVSWRTSGGNSGNAVSSAAIDRRYYLCLPLSTGTATTATQNCMVRQKNNKWVFWRGPTVGAMGTYNYNAIAGDGGTSGKVWKIMQPGSYDDDGSTISAYWVSADWTDNLVFNRKTLHEMWVDAMAVAKSSVTMAYAVDKSSQWNNYTFYLDNGQAPSVGNLPSVGAVNGVINKWVPIAKGYDMGKYIRVKFSDSTQSYFRIPDYLLFIEDQGHQVP